MRRKRVVRSPRRKAAFSKTELKRGIKTAQSLGLPVTRIELPNGVSLVVGNTGKADDTTTNPWDEVLTNAAHEKRSA